MTTEQKLSQKHLLDIPSLSVEDIEKILDRAFVHKKNLANNTVNCSRLKGKTIISFFAEPSTRTRVSFEMAAYRLGANIISWDEEKSSSVKGETFSDTIAYLATYNPDALIIRHKDYNAPHFVATKMNCPVINGGDSYRAHPTQALLDAMTILEHKKTLKNLRVAICGDVAHSRVAADNMALLSKMGAHVNIIAPQNLLPQKSKFENVNFFTNLKEGLEGADIVMTLRLQKERMEAAAIPDEISYHHHFGITTETLAFAKPDAFVMHPGPMNRGIEITDTVADSARSLILEQAKNSIPLRMAVLDLWMGE